MSAITDKINRKLSGLDKTLEELDELVEKADEEHSKLADKATKAATKAAAKVAAIEQKKERKLGTIDGKASALTVAVKKAKATAAFFREGIAQQMDKLNGKD